MFRLTLLAGALLLSPLAHAQGSPIAQQYGPDLQFACNSYAGAVRQCHPVHSYYKRYMHLANWRFVGSNSAPGTCVLGRTYGYGRTAVWVSGGCDGVFRAPDLRYGDAYNMRRLANDPSTYSTIIVEPGARVGAWRNW